MPSSPDLLVPDFLILPRFPDLLVLSSPDPLLPLSPDAGFSFPPYPLIPGSSDPLIPLPSHPRVTVILSSAYPLRGELTWHTRALPYYLHVLSLACGVVDCVGELACHEGACGALLCRVVWV